MERVMKLSNEQKYRLLEQAEPNELKRLYELVEKSHWRQSYHIQPPIGLLNDPNGFTYYQGEYHLFYQWFPLGTDHGMKYWYHTKSRDLAEWEDVGIGITPGGRYDSHGAYSGSGIVKDELLYLMYTGNTRDQDWVRHPFQNMAIMDTSGGITKREMPVIDAVPHGYTDHFRDPKVWEQEGRYWCVIGAQRTDHTGCTVLYSSEDLMEWSFEGEISTRLDPFGYMWECPDYFELDGQGVLLFSPQGIEPQGAYYSNIYQSGYVVGAPLQLDTRSFAHGDFQELDRGFDFYAQQTTVAPDGRRILVGWMGLPEIDYPTDEHGWAHCLTLPRELTLREGKLIQRPARELERLRQEHHHAQVELRDECVSFTGFEGSSYELLCQFDTMDGDRFGIEFRIGTDEKTVLTYDRKLRQVVLDRSRSGKPVAVEYGEQRSCSLEADQIRFHLFVDTSSVEIFVNDGEEVFTSRIFPETDSTGIRFFAEGGTASCEADWWKL